MRSFLPLVITLFLSTIAARPDVAPTEFIGSGIVPKSHSTIQMISAKVEITWGTPCELSAIFVMQNDSLSSETVDVGFPIPMAYGVYGENLPEEPLLIYFGDLAPVIAQPQKNPESRQDDRGNWQWHVAKHSFKPGTTKVAVKTKQWTSRVYASPFNERILYCIQTGSHWAKKIGSEEVVLRFPEKLPPASFSKANHPTTSSQEIPSNGPSKISNQPTRASTSSSQSFDPKSIRSFRT